MTARDDKAARDFVQRSYHQYGPELRRYLKRKLRNEQDARELAQEVWTRLLRVSDAREVLEPMAYIYTAARNVISEFHLRRRRDCVSIDSEATEVAAELASAGSGDEVAEQLVRQAELVRLLAGMPETYRKIVTMKICEGLTSVEVGQRLGFSEGTVHQYFFRAMNLLRNTRNQDKRTR